LQLQRIQPVNDLREVPAQRPKEPVMNAIRQLAYQCGASFISFRLSPVKCCPPLWKESLRTIRPMLESTLKKSVSGRVP
jgi:hypothetical protein